MLKLQMKTSLLKYYKNILSLKGELDQSPILLILMDLLVNCLKTI